MMYVFEIFPCGRHSLPKSINTKVNTMADDDLMMQGAKASAAMVIILQYSTSLSSRRVKTLIK